MLRAKKPIIKEARFKSVIYANRGVGKTHFCCSFPNTYYIDSEGLESHPHFVKMLVENESDLVRLNEFSDIIAEVKTLLSTKHDYRTLVIDSLSFPFHLLANMEADRLAKKGRGDTEGTEFGANLAKAKRQTFELGMLLSRLDMNVICTAHEKSKYLKNEEIGKSADINEKMEYSLGSVIHLMRMGDKIKARFEKSRYEALPTGGYIDFDNGFEVLCEKLGRNIFVKESEPVTLATPEQIEKAKHLIVTLNVPEDWLNKRLASCYAQSFETMTEKDMQSLIDLMLDRLNNKGNNQ